MIARLRCRICNREHSTLPVDGISYKSMELRRLSQSCPNGHTSNSILFIDLSKEKNKTIPTILYSGSIVPVDADLVAFKAACLVSSVTLTPTEESAIATMITGLKSSGIWAKAKAIYPMIGGVAGTHKLNLKDPRDADNAFRLSFIGSPTHSTNGVAWNGTTQYADTFLNPTVSLGQNDTHLSYYSRTDSAGSEVEMGIYDAATTSGAHMTLNYTNEIYYAINSVEYLAYTALGTASKGLYSGSRISSTQEFHKRYNEAVRTDTVASASSAFINNTMFLGAFRVGAVPSAYSAKQCAFASIGLGLTSSQLDSLYSIVQTYQTTLGRQV